MQFNYKMKYLGIIFILILGYFFLYNYSSSIGGHTVCIFKNITGIPCPACGSTRATILLLHGNIWESILMNPFGIITNFLIFGSVCWMIYDIIKGRDTFFVKMKMSWDKRIKIILILIIVVNWIWNIKKGL